jgi:hypothetical protein
VLTGLEPERVVAALAAVNEWRLPRVAAALDEDTEDAAVAATLLVEGIALLDERGVPRARLLKKLRTGDFWSTWSEIRVATVMVEYHGEELGVELEPDRAAGAQPDWRFQFPGDPRGIAVEVKAVGLSDAEVAFYQRMWPVLRRTMPRVGLGHGHATIGAPVPRAPGRARRTGAPISRDGARRAPNYPQGLRGSVMVGHDTEEHYRRRIAARVAGAVRQLPTSDECWVALYWSNGAPLADATSSIDWAMIPAHVAGVIFVGQGVAFPDRQIHVFITPVPRGLQSKAEIAVDSLEGERIEELAQLVLARFERSSGVRATLLRVGNRDLIKRDGSRRIDPFNLLMDADPVFDGQAGFAGREHESADDGPIWETLPLPRRGRP